MIIFLWGPDSYRRLQKQREIISEYKKRHSSLAVEYFNFENAEDEAERFKSFLKSRSLFDDSRLAVAAAVAAAREKGRLVEILRGAAAAENSFVVLSEEKKLPADFKFLEDKAVLKQEFNLLGGGEFKRFIKKEALRRQVSLTEKAAAELAAVCEGDSWAAINELEKIALIPEGVGFQFSVFDFSLPLPSSVFQLIYALRGGSLRKRFAALEKLLKGEDAAKIFNLTAYSAGGKPRFADYDAAVKAGKMDYEMALLDWIIG